MDGHSANILAKNPVERWVNDLRKRAPTKRGAGRKSLLEELLYVSTTYSRCLKIIEKVSFNIASEASYVYILSGQKLIKNASF